jgi:hypothetical protein
LNKPADLEVVIMVILYLLREDANLERLGAQNQPRTLFVPNNPGYLEITAFMLLWLLC